MRLVAFCPWLTYTYAVDSGRRIEMNRRNLMAALVGGVVPVLGQNAHDITSGRGHTWLESAQFFRYAFQYIQRAFVVVSGSRPDSFSLDASRLAMIAQHLSSAMPGMWASHISGQYQQTITIANDQDPDGTPVFVARIRIR